MMHMGRCTIYYYYYYYYYYDFSIIVVYKDRPAMQCARIINKQKTQYNARDAAA